MATQIVCLLALMASINTALALTCYKCDASENKFCDYGGSSFTFKTTDCTEKIYGDETQQCAKFIVEDKKGNQFVARDCMPVGNKTACIDVIKQLNLFSKVYNISFKENCERCNGDKCNFGTNFGPYTVFSIILSATVLII